jgi:hypothetical protein
VKDVGEPCEGEPHARFDAAAGGDRRLWPTGPPALGASRRPDHGRLVGGRVEGDISSRVEVGGAYPHRRPKGASMLADLDLLLIAVFCAADDLLP